MRPTVPSRLAHGGDVVGFAAADACVCLYGVSALLVKPVKNRTRGESDMLGADVPESSACRRHNGWTQWTLNIIWHS